MVSKSERQPEVCGGIKIVPMNVKMYLVCSMKHKLVRIYGSERNQCKDGDGLVSSF